MQRRVLICSEISFDFSNNIDLMASEEFPINEVTLAKIDALDIPPEWKKLIKLAAQSNVKMTMSKIVRIWQIDENRPIPGLDKQILWVEDNLPQAGYQHMLKHADEFEQIGITKDQLSEIAEAATTVGIPGGQQGNKGKRLGRPIFGLFFYGKPLAVAVSVGSNGFVVGMNRSSWERFKIETKLTDANIEELASWPTAGLD